MTARPLDLGRLRSPGAIRRLVRVETLTTATLVAALALWGLSLRGIDPREMSDLGLVSVLPATFYMALALVCGGFLALVHLRASSTRLLAGHVAALLLVLHATAPLAYDTLRYAWAWKHLGIVDYIQRTGGVTPDITQLGVYHAWPGFFAFAALIQDLSGLDDLQTLAAWAPLAIATAAAGAVAFCLSSLTRDRRVLWLGVGIYVIANWVGQEYFSPQGFAFVLYLVLIGTVLRRLRPAGLGTAARLPARLSGRLARAPGDPATAPAGRARPIGVVAACVALVAAIVVSHALTSIMVTLILTALVVAGCCRVRTLPLWSAGLVAVWAATFARDYVGPNLSGTLGAIDFPWATAEENLVDTGALSPGQQFVAGTSRYLVLLVAFLALCGAVRLLRARRLDPVVVVLAGAPGLLFLTGDYDGELVFRIYLFAVPFLALLIAEAVPLDRGPRAIAVGASATVMALVLAGFVITHFGNDRQYTFTADEVAAAEGIYRAAEPGSLLVQGTRNAPVQFLNYERFTYLTIADEPPETHVRVVADPVGVIAGWLDDPRYSGAILFITRSQAAEADALGRLPAGSLPAIEAAIAGSSRFIVERGPDHLIARLRPPITCADVPPGAGPAWRDGSRLGVPCPAGVR